MKWSEIDFSELTMTEKRGGGTKITPSLRFQIPSGRVLYDGISSYKSVTLEMPEEFAVWWNTVLDKELCTQEPFRSNMKDNCLRVKIDTLTQFFDEKKKSIFPSIEEGSLRSSHLTCLIEITGVYYFQEVYGLVVRAHQIVVHPAVLEVEEEPEVTTKLTGFAFI